MKNFLFITSCIIVIALLIGYYLIIGGWIELKENTDTPDKFVNRTQISIDDYNKDKSALESQFKNLIRNHDGFFNRKEYFEGTGIIIDTILYSPQYDKLAVLLITKNSTSRQLMSNKKEDWYYNATPYLGVRQNDSIELSWLGPSFSNSPDLSRISQLLRDKCFRTFVTKDTTSEFGHKYNLNDIRFWTSNEWPRIEEKKKKRIEFEKEKREHPENISEPK